MHLKSSTLVVGALLTLGAVAQPAATRPAAAPSAAPAAPAAAPAAPAAPRPAAPAEDDWSERLGQRFTSLSNGITFRPPAGGKADRRLTDNADLIVRFDAASREDEAWSLVVTRKVFEVPTQLVAVDDPLTREDEGKRAGVLDELARQLRTNDQTLQVLRKDVVRLGPHDAGLLASRYVNPQSKKVWFRQHALLRAHPRVYYIFDFTAPSTWTPADNEVDPTEQVAVEVFDAMLDSVRLLDTSGVEAEVTDRLFKTRTLMVNLPQRVEKSVAARLTDVLNDPVPHAPLYLRVMRGKEDVGYTYVAEWMGERHRERGLFVATLTHSKSENGMVLDVASEMFSTPRPMDRAAHEEWVTVTKLKAKDGKEEHVSEYGQSKRRQGLVRDDAAGAAAVEPPGAPGAPAPAGGGAGVGGAGQASMRVANYHTLHVRQITRGGARPITRELPAWYLPQTMSHMLPRLLPLEQQGKYLFAVWVSGAPAVVNRFLDVEPVQAVKFAGREVQAITVKDRLGYEGEATFHYFTPEGAYLGSHTPATQLTAIATDEATLKKLWPAARIGRPQVLDTPEARDGDGPAGNAGR